MGQPAVQAAPPASPETPTVPATPGRLFLDCLLLGVTAWGGFMALLAQAQNRFVQHRRWLSEGEFADLIALVSLLPGPQAVNALALMGHRLLGWAGFTAALLGIVAPGFAIVSALWWGYGWLQAYPHWQQALTWGVLAPLAMILAQAAFTQAKKATPGWKERALAAVAAALLLALPFGAAPLLVMAGAALVARLAWPAPALKGQAPRDKLRTRTWLLCLAPAGLAVFQLWPDLLPAARSSQLGLAFAGLSTTLFGGGLVMVPLLEDLVVQRLHWLDGAGFSAALAASQLTPGPILSVATFTGLQAGGLAGALAATAGIYLPTALITVGAGGLAAHLQHAQGFQHAMLGVRCAVVGLIAGAALSLLWRLPLLALPAACGLWLAVAALLVLRWRQPPWVSLGVGVLLAWVTL
jgi:chromate transporter